MTSATFRRRLGKLEPAPQRELVRVFLLNATDPPPPEWVDVPGHITIIHLCGPEVSDVASA